ncbi:MAG TPA: hypothetical protein PKC99_14290 [Anaerolineales bacterium]|nr:hypothetical protein [Anaerolineales bacterium]NOG75315.1 hypothetical protein [Chloroflexota bacterium]GIK43982.1 MAG: hypothetical protein BroJett011_78150 [Chloroflexota bacterium]HMN00177.1 hypothetical protein [Anaerolineales bacterium]
MPAIKLDEVAAVITAIGVLTLGLLQIFRRPLQPATKDRVDASDASDKVASSAGRVVEASESVMARMDRQIQQLEAERLRAQNEIRGLKADNEALRAENTELRLALGRVQRECGEIREKNIELEKRVNALVRTVDELLARGKGAVETT